MRPTKRQTVRRINAGRRATLWFAGNLFAVILCSWGGPNLFPGGAEPTALAQSPPSDAELKRFEKTEIHMGSPFTLIFYSADENLANRAQKLAFERIAQLDKVLSDYDLESEASRLCASAPHSTPQPASKELFDALSLSAKFHEASGGAFDVTVGPLTKLWRRARRQKTLPPADQLEEALGLVGMEQVRLDDQNRTVQIARSGVRLDFGGIGQGIAADEVVKIVSEMGITRCLVNASGDVVALDPPPGEKGWKVALVGLQPKDEPPREYLLLRNAAVTTSGDAFQWVEIDGKRYSHIVDSKTGLGVQRRCSATVIAPTGAAADAWATALTVLPTEEGIARLTRAEPNAHALVVEMRDDKPISTVSPGFPPRHKIAVVQEE